MSLTDIVGNTACDHIMRSDLGQGVRTVFRLSLLSRAENLCLHCCISVPTEEVVVIPDDTDMEGGASIAKRRISATSPRNSSRRLLVLQALW